MFSSFPIWKLLKYDSIKCWQNFSNGNVCVGALTIKWYNCFGEVSRKVEICIFIMIVLQSLYVDIYDSRGFQIFLFQPTPRNNIFISQPSAPIMYVYVMCFTYFMSTYIYNWKKGFTNQCLPMQHWSSNRLYSILLNESFELKV